MSARVTTVLGVMRGFDAVDVNGVPVLVSADVALPCHTTTGVAAVACDFSNTEPRWLGLWTDGRPTSRSQSLRCCASAGRSSARIASIAWFESIGSCGAGRIVTECE